MRPSRRLLVSSGPPGPSGAVQPALGALRRPLRVACSAGGLVAGRPGLWLALGLWAAGVAGGCGVPGRVLPVGCGALYLFPLGWARAWG